MKKLFVTVASTMIAVSAFAQGTAPAASSTPAMTAGAASSSMAAKPKRTASSRVEMQIKRLHAELKITPAEEDKWGAVAATMRDNAAQIDQLSATRASSEGTYNAVDDLKSYSDIAAAHADGVKKLVTVFEPLYDSLSPSQKQTADAVFHNAQPGNRHRGAKAASKTGPNTAH
jgi:protein CpxP